MQIFDRYIFKSLLGAVLFTALVLAAIILLTQSLKFLELVINAGASGQAFWMLTLMALPRFFEIILPVAMMIATVFVYNRMALDCELTALRAAGLSPLRLARPALLAAGLVTAVLLVTTLWLAPVSQRDMNHMRLIIKAQYSTLLFREGVFNAVQPGLTVYIRDRLPDGSLRGVMIHDSRSGNQPPVTVLAKSGVIVATPEGQQVVVYDGSRQSLGPDRNALERLDFERYIIDLPEGSAPAAERWRDPDERTFSELLTPDLNNARDVENRKEFIREAQRRVIGPFLAPAYTLAALVFLLLGPVGRRGQGWRPVLAVGSVVLLQGLYLTATSLSRQTGFGMALMYAVAFVPAGLCIFLLSERAGGVRARLFSGAGRKVAA